MVQHSCIANVTNREPRCFDRGCTYGTVRLNEQGQRCRGFQLERAISAGWGQRIGIVMVLGYQIRSEHKSVGETNDGASQIHQRPIAASHLQGSHPPFESTRNGKC